MTNRNMFVLALCLLGMGYCVHGIGAVDFVSPPLATGLSSADPNYCPPGAKFCPAPGADNTVYLDTHFGMDAKTGEVIAYKGNVHPNDVVNPPMTGERVLYVSPPISVENRYVPYPDAAQSAVGPGPELYAQSDPVYSSHDMSQLARTQSPSRRAASRTAESEVANKQTDRSSRESAAAKSGEKPWWKGGLWSRGEDIAQAEADDGKIPWWKGGMWRNRKDEDSDDSSDVYLDDASDVRSDDPAKAPPAAGSRGNLRTLTSSNRVAAAAKKAPPASPEDMWRDEAFDEYASDGSFGDQYAQYGQYGDQYGRYAQEIPYDGRGYSPDPYSGPAYNPSQPMAQYQYYDPYGQPVRSAPGGFVGDVYTLPASPPSASPYYQDGYASPGANPVAASPYQQPMYADYPAGQSMLAYAPQASSPGFPPPPLAASVGGVSASSSGNGSLQLENAKRMVREDRFTEAKNLLLDETRSNPRSAEAWRWLADCHYNLLELDDAIATYSRALDNDPNDYYALRGQGFSYLHRGHEYWRRMQEEVAGGSKDQAAHTFSQAHENYKKALELLGLCLRRAPNDGEAIYGEAMAAEGASRKLYSNAISYIKLGPDQRERAEVFAENCITVINKGIERSREKARLSPGDVGPRALMGGLFLRKAILYNQLGKNDLALVELKNSRDVQQSILDEIDKNNGIARKNIQEIETLWSSWGGDSR